MGMGIHRALIAGLMGLFGGFGGTGNSDVIRVPRDDKRPSVDDVWNRLSRKNTRHRFMTAYQQSTVAKRKRRWKIAKMSRKKNYARNGTRG